MQPILGAGIEHPAEAGCDNNERGLVLQCTMCDDVSTMSMRRVTDETTMLRREYDERTLVEIEITIWLWYWSALLRPR